MTRHRLLLSASLAFFCGCSQDRPPPPAAASVPITERGPAPIEALARMDTRTSVPHWPTDRYLELAPKYWNATRARLNAGAASQAGSPRHAVVRPERASGGRVMEGSPG